MSKSESKELAEASSHEMAVPFDDELLMQDAGQGMEDMDSTDFTIPYFGILQSLSPQVKKNDPAYIKGAEEGMFYNSASGKVYSGEAGVILVPVHYLKRYVEWGLREKGGGLVKDWGADSSNLDRASKDDRGRMVTPEGTQMVTTGTYYALVVNPEDGEYERVIIAMSSTMLRQARKWNNLMSAVKALDPKSGKRFNPASWYQSYLATSIPDSNDKGSWMTWKIEYGEKTVDLPNGREIYLDARDFHGSIKSGDVKAAPPVEENDADDLGNDAF